MQEPTVFKIVDTTGVVHHKGLTSAQASAFMSLMLANGQFPGLRSERMDAAPPANTGTGTPALAAAFIAEQATSKAIANIEPGTERDVLREAIDTHTEAEKAFRSAQEGVDRVKQHRQQCELELAQRQTTGEHEIATAGAALAARLKAGEPAPLEPNLGTGRAAILDAEARLAAAVEACAVLDSELAAAKQALDAQAASLKLAVTAVIRADQQAWIGEAEQLWARLGALRNLIESARYVDVPCDARAVVALRPHEYAINRHAELFAYQTALTVNADVRFDAAPATGAL